MNSSGRPPTFSTPQPTRTFPFAQTPSNTPFLFHAPAGVTPPPAGFWKPPQDFSPRKAFPPVVETADVSMGDVTNSPTSVNQETKGDASTTDEEQAVATLPARKVSTNAVKRVIKGRRRAQSRIAKRSIEEDENGCDSETEEEEYTREGLINHHYTFNMPGLPANRADMLLGCVGSILVLFFNLMEFTAAIHSSSLTSLSFWYSCIWLSTLLLTCREMLSTVWRSIGLVGTYCILHFPAADHQYRSTRASGGVRANV